MNDVPSSLQICEPEIHVTFNLERKGIISSISARTKLFFQNLIEDELAAILKKKNLRWLSTNTRFKFDQSVQRIFNNHLCNYTKNEYWQLYHLYHHHLPHDTNIICLSYSGNPVNAHKASCLLLRLGSYDEFEVRTISYGRVFFRWFMDRALRAWAINQLEKTRIRILQHGPRKRYLLWG